MVPEGEYILNKVEVKSDSAGYNAGALKQYVRQKEKPKLFSLFKNPFSKKPVGKGLGFNDVMNDILDDYQEHRECKLNCVKLQ